MNLRWVADGIEVAERAGGVTLDKRNKTGFSRGTQVKQRPASELSVSGFDIESDPEPDDYEDR